MEQFELQKPISQLFGALKSHFLESEPFSYRSFRTTEQNPLFQKNNFCDVITSPLYLVKHRVLAKKHATAGHLSG